MALYIRNEDVDQGVRALAALTGESITEAVSVAVAERLERERRKQSSASRRVRVHECAARFAALVGQRSPDVADPAAFLYDDAGLPS